MSKYPILIISQSNFEDSTTAVCDWLIKYQVDFIRLNVDEIFNPDLYKININISNNLLQIYDIRRMAKIDLSQVKVAWCRRFVYSFTGTNYLEESISYNTMEFARFISSEVNKFLRTLYDFYPHICWFDNYKDILSIDKIDVLKKAKKVGLLIPETVITNDYKSIDSKQRIITKPLGEATSFKEDEKFLGLYVTHTQEVNKIFMKNFIPSLFQKQIDKKLEIRVFYLDEKFYSMAIVSNNNSKTKIDFRKYDYVLPNRFLPFSLPMEIKTKISRLMKELNLTNGSIDFILDLRDNYYFLEVNPVGQFSMVSKPCNYNIEKDIANWLIKKNK